MQDKTRIIVRAAELRLSRPADKQLRKCLIRQIFYGDRVLAHLRDGTDCTEANWRLQANVKAAHCILNRCDEFDRR
jgi:hypothetical protein